MDGTREYNLSGISQSEKDKYHKISLICVIEETKQMSKGEKRERERERPRNIFLTIENKLMDPRRKVGGGWVK